MVVIIPTHSRNALLRRTLESVSEAKLPPGTTVLVVENGGRLGAEGVLEEFDGRFPADYLYVERGNKSAALNAALETLPDQLVVFLDDDVRFGPDLFEHYHAFGVARGPGTFFGGPMECDYEVEIPGWLLEFLPASVRGWTLGSEVQEVMEPGLLGLNWAAFVSDLKEAGGFDPNFGPGSTTGATGQESEMQIRLLTRGATGLFLPKARVWHYVRDYQADPDWCLRRSYRTGLQKGLLEARDDVVEFLGRPRWTYRELAGLVWKRATASLFRDPATRFRPRFEMARLRGYRAGWVLAKTHGPRRRLPGSRNGDVEDPAIASGS